MAQLGFFFDQTRCTGCHTCAVACKDWHDIDAGPVNWIQVHVIEDGKFPNPFVAYLARACYHCVNPPCSLACPAGAITKRTADGVVIVDSERCLGNIKCNTRCLNACPWGAPQFGPEKDAKMQKCDFCLERLQQDLQPICVDSCPMYALDAGPIDQIKSKHGNEMEAEGFRYSGKFKPSVTFKPKKRHQVK